MKIKLVARAFLAVFFLLFIFAYPHHSAFAVADTCDNDYINAYTCPAALVATCTDVQGDQYRTVTCIDQSVNGTITNTSKCGSFGLPACPTPSSYPTAPCDANNTTDYSSTGNSCSATGGSVGCSHNWYSNWTDGTWGLQVTCYPPDSYGTWVQCTTGTPCGPQPICPSGAPLGLERTTEYDLQGSANAYGYAVATDTSGNAYVTGEQYSLVNGIDMYVIKYKPDGTQDRTWGQSGINTYDTTSVDPQNNIVHGNESGYGVAVDDSNNVYVVGKQESVNGANSIWFIRKYNSAGSLVWSIPNTGDPGISGVARGVAVDATGDVYTVGYIQNAGGDTDLLLLKNNGSTGAEMWRRAYSAPGTGNAAGWAVAVDNIQYLGVYVTGYYQPTADNTDALTVKYDLAGTFIWERGYDSGSNQTDLGKAIAVEPDINHDIDVSGYQDTNGGDMFIRKYDPGTGGDSTIYPSPYNSGGTQSDVGRGSAPAGRERYFFIGSQSTNGGDVFLREYVYPGSGSTYVSPEQSNNLTNTTYGSNKTTQEIGYGIAGSPAHFADASGAEAATAITTFYVTGYSSANGGQMFLNKYSCNVAPTGGLVVSTTAAKFSTTPESGIDPLTVFVDASDSAGNIKKYEWDWTYDNNIGFRPSGDTGVTYSHTYTAPGTYLIALRVTNSIGEVDVSDPRTTITVNPNTAPTASFTVTPSSGPMPLTVTADGSSSADLVDVLYGGKVVSFAWDWGDGTAPQTGGAIMRHTYTNLGTYTVRLTVTDNGGASSAPVTQQVVVNENYVCSPACPVTASACGAMPPACPGATPSNLPTGTTSTTIGLTDVTSQTCVYAKYAPGTPLAASSTMALFTTTNSKVSSADVTDVVDGRNVYYARCYDTGTATTTRDAYAPACSIAFDVGAVSAATGMCYQCVSNSDCGTGYTCNKKDNTCVLGGNSLPAQCWVESIGTCTSNANCTASVQGGVCTGASVGVSGSCYYARCLNTTATACVKDSDCTNGDGICNPTNNTCDYVYDCAYGPGLGVSIGGKYATSTIPQMPAMPLGVQANGEACTQPTPSAPNNCQGINGCLYYSYNSNGTPVAGSNSSVANCQDKFNGGSGCMYYSMENASTPDYPCTIGSTCANGALCITGTCSQKINCLADTKSKKYPGVSNPVGIPLGCFVVDKGKGKKDYDCSAVDGCYYANDGSIDCTYGVTGGIQGNGCLYETNPAGATFCPGVSKAPTAGNNFVQCLLNPNASLPGFVTGTSSSALLPCKTNTDCPASNICVNGTCYPQCQNNQDCISGQQCTTPPAGCTPGTVCPNGAVCPANGICPPPPGCTPGTICPNGVVCPVSGICPPPPGCIPGTVCPNGAACPVNGTCGNCVPGTICPNGVVCPISGICPPPPGCIPGTVCPNGAICPVSGICPPPPGCIPGTVCPNGAICPVSGICPGNCTPGSICPNGAICPVSGICPGNCTPGSICPNGAICPVSGVCPVTTCTPGTICPNSATCPVNGICPNITPTCPPGNYYDSSYGVCCPNGTMYNAGSGQCTTGTFLSFCEVNPLSPLCSSGGPGPGWVGLTGTASCNTLGITFYGTAITPTGNCNLVAIILALLQWLAWFIGLLAVLSGLRAAYLYITSVGDQKRLSLARSYLIYTTIGVGVALLSYGIVSLTRAIMNI